MEKISRVEVLALFKRTKNYVMNYSMKNVLNVILNSHSHVFSIFVKNYSWNFSNASKDAHPVIHVFVYPSCRLSATNAKAELVPQLTELANILTDFLIMHHYAMF